MGLHHPHTDRVILSSAGNAGNLLSMVALICLAIVIAVAVPLMLAVYVSSAVTTVAQANCFVANLAQNNPAIHPAVPPMMSAWCLQDLRLKENIWNVLLVSAVCVVIWGALGSIWLLTMKFIKGRKAHRLPH